MLPDILVELAADDYYPWSRSSRFRLYWTRYHLFEEVLHDTVRACLRESISDAVSDYLDAKNAISGHLEPYEVRREFNALLDDEVRECLQECIQEMADETILRLRIDEIIDSLVTDLALEMEIVRAACPYCICTCQLTRSFLDFKAQQALFDRDVEWVLDDLVDAEVADCIDAECTLIAREMGIDIIPRSDPRNAPPRSFFIDGVMRDVVLEILLAEMLGHLAASSTHDSRTSGADEQ
ncbi:hypothetical protein HK105_200773 [Polyrhizophydium stewartii]|uniref:Uncharacterized protein n=1 Tax=Polyrhizophydium stewartii TaxID=2732419 RepID=A0ABR4NK25_9FUNG